MTQYTYDDPVMSFGVCVANRWRGTTYAPTEKRARSNLAYQYKKMNGKAANAKITLPGDIFVVERKEASLWTREI